MRTGVLTATAFLTLCLAVPVLAAGVDPLAALDGDRAMDARSYGKRPKDNKPDPLAAMAPVKPEAAVSLPTAAPEALPQSFNTGGFTPALPPAHGGGSVPGGGGGGVWAGPTAPTPPTLPAIMAPNAPLWKFGD